ncbi:MAG: AraC family transcriptional regulator [Acutalibacteraceae bacterium]
MKKCIDSHRNYTQEPDLTMFRMHTHEMYEIYCFLSGNAKYFVEGNIYELKPGDVLIMKKAEAHSLLINHCIPYERIIVNFNNEAILSELRSKITDFIDNRPLGQNNRYPASMFKESNWIYYLNKICDCEDIVEKKIYLTVLLNELCDNYSKIQGKEMVKDNIIDIINYINRHLTENLSLDVICNRFFVSKTHINRKFKQMTGSTVWEYILTKRLILAKEMLQNGQRPTAVSLQCGFNDYCSFFKAYKNRFNVSPKDDYLKNQSEF